jgi:hypothetical protein
MRAKTIDRARRDRVIGDRSHELLSPPPRTPFRQVVYLVYHYYCADLDTGLAYPLALALLGSRFAVCRLFVAA